MEDDNNNEKLKNWCNFHFEEKRYDREPYFVFCAVYDFWLNCNLKGICIVELLIGYLFEQLPNIIYRYIDIDI